MEPREIGPQDADRLVSRASLFSGGKWHVLAEFDPPIRLADAQPEIERLKSVFAAAN